MAQQQAKARCQCDPSCTRPPLPRSPFCAVHQPKKDGGKGCPRQAPLSGSEPAFDPDRYNKHPGIKESHNCYAYAFGYLKLPKKCSLSSCPVPYPQPGRASGYPKWSKVKGKRCPDLAARMMGDVPGMRPSTFEKKCPKGMTKIAAVVAPKQDYHYLRQDSDGGWSHKPGATQVTRVDATQRPIYDPSLASRDYPSSGLNYKNFCGFWCIPASRKEIRLRRGGGRATRRRATGKGRAKAKAKA